MIGDTCGLDAIPDARWALDSRVRCRADVDADQQFPDAGTTG